MAPAHAGLGGRIIVRFILRSERRLRDAKRVDPRGARHQGSAHGDAHPVEEISPRDGSAQA